MSFKPDLNQFMNPAPTLGKKLKDDSHKKHGKTVGSFLDDTGDIYDHTKSFFEGETNAKMEHEEMN